MIIGLTGGIGSGKSTVAKIFESMGCVIYNSDDVAKALYFDPSIKLKIIELLGSAAYISSTEIDKKYISNKIFADSNLLQRLNLILHPAVKLHFEQFVKPIPYTTIIVKESALLFETSLYRQTEKNILVTAPSELRIERTMLRDHLTKEEVELKMSKQWPDEKKIPLSDFVIINDNHTPLLPQVTSVLEKLKLMV